MAGVSFSLWSLAAGAIGGIGGLILGLITAVITGGIARIFFKTKLPFNWDNAILPGGVCVGIGVIAGLIIGTIHSETDAGFEETINLTLLFTLIGPPLALVFGVWMAWTERKLEKMIDRHPNAAMIYSEILAEHERQKEIAKQVEEIDSPLRINVMEEVMRKYGLLEDAPATPPTNVPIVQSNLAMHPPQNTTMVASPHIQETVDKYGVKRRTNGFGQKEWWDGQQWQVVTQPPRF